MSENPDPRSPTPCCKIVDFGTAKKMKKGKLEGLSGRMVDNPVWLAPEIMKQEPYNETVGMSPNLVVLPASGLAGARKSLSFAFFCADLWE